MSLAKQGTDRTVRQFSSAGGAQIFQIPVEQFPGLWGHVYLALYDDPQEGAYRVLIDTGSGFGECNQHLEAGLETAVALYGQPLGLETLTHVLITHGHIDHFGGLSYVRPRTQAKIGVHELDLRNLTNYEERLAVASRRLGEYLVEAGVPEERWPLILALYQMTKALHHSVRVDFTYEAMQMRLGPFELLHVPGHCAGHVAIRLHDVLFSGDHVLASTTPHQSPERLTLSTGLEHYLRSLEALLTWAGEVRLTLGGHEEPVADLAGRVAEIRGLHQQRLDKVLGLLEAPHTVQGVSEALFGEVQGYDVLLALEEAGAHVEYLYQRGYLSIENLAELENNRGPAPVCYRRL